MKKMWLRDGKLGLFYKGNKNLKVRLEFAYPEVREAGPNVQ